jgi:NitT/TauT family transport system ATP-binding protein
MKGMCMAVQRALRNIRKSFAGKAGPVDVLGGLTFDINERDFVSIIGPSGSARRPCSM